MGDIIALKYEAGADNTGHAMVALGVTAMEPVPPLAAGTTQWAVRVVDSTDSYHGPADTRTPPSTQGGIGMGTFRIYAVASTGAVVGYAWSSYANSIYYGEANRTIAVGRLLNVSTNNATASTPATSPSNPTTTTAPPSRKHRRMRVVLSGRYWKIVLDSGRDVVSAAVRQDIAVALGILASYINILSLAPGSLIVEFEATDSATDTKAISVVSAALNNMALTATQPVYFANGGASNETVSVTSVQSVDSGADKSCGLGCILIIVVAAALVVVLIATAVVLCTSKKPRAGHAPTDEEMRENKEDGGGEEAHSTANPLPSAKRRGSDEVYRE